MAKGLVGMQNGHDDSKEGAKKPGRSVSFADGVTFDEASYEDEPPQPFEHDEDNGHLPEGPGIMDSPQTSGSPKHPLRSVRLVVCLLLQCTAKS